MGEKYSPWFFLVLAISFISFFIYITYYAEIFLTIFYFGMSTLGLMLAVQLIYILCLFIKEKLT